MIFVTSTAPLYSKPWLFDTLTHLLSGAQVTETGEQTRVLVLLHPEDRRRLPQGVEQVEFTGDRYYQDGRFLDAMPGSLKHVPDDEVVVLMDCDAILQRPVRGDELLPPVGGFALGFNKGPGQTGEDEFYSLEGNPRHSLEAVCTVIGVEPTSFKQAKVYNWGLVSARAHEWRRLHAWYLSHINHWGKTLFNNPCYMQLLMCVGLHELKLPVRELGYQTHSHAHFRLTPSHSIHEREDGSRVLMYREGSLVEVVLFAHAVPGLFGPKLPTGLLNEHRFDSCGAEFNYVRGLVDMLNVVKPSSVLEIGSYRGVSSETFARFIDHAQTEGSKRLVCLDSNITPELKSRMSGWSFVELVEGRSPEMLSKIDGKFDLVYVDGDHGYQSVKDDVKAACRLVRAGGFVGGHDFGNPYTPDVEVAVREVLGDVMVFKDTSWCLQM